MANLKPPRGPASSRELADFVRWVSFPSFPFTVASATDTFTARATPSRMASKCG